MGCWITFHNNNGTTKGKSRVVIKNNYVRDGSVIVNSMGESTEITQFIISGNRFTQGINNLDTETTNVNIEVLDFNNQIG